MDKTLSSYDFVGEKELTVTITLHEYRNLIQSQSDMRARISDLEQQVVDATGCKPLDRTAVGVTA